MRTIILFLSSMLLWSGCSSKKTNDEVYYIIKHDTIAPAPVSSDNDEPPPPPPPPWLFEFYGAYNFILADDSTIYYHTRNKTCYTGLNWSKPCWISLRPENISEIKIDSLGQFLKSIPDSLIADRQFCISISSPTDTIRNKAYPIIEKFLKSKKITFYRRRNLTEEETYALKAKLENKTYDPDHINWKIGFSDK